MKRSIVDYTKLTPEITSLLVEKFSDGYGIRDVVKFTAPNGKYIEALEVSNDEYIYLVKISEELFEEMNYFREHNSLRSA